MPDETSGSDATDQALAGLATEQMQAVAKEWAGHLGSEVTFETPRVRGVRAADVAQALAWPVTCAKFAVEGAAKGEFLVLLRSSDVPAPHAGGEDSARVAQRLMDLAARATQRGFRAVLEGKTSVRLGSVKEVKDVAALAGEGVPFEGWLVEVTFTAGKAAPAALRELVPGDLGAGLGKIYRGHARASGGAKGKVLVVEDSYLIRSLVRRHLTQEGYEVVEAVNGVEALQKIRRERVVAVLLDVMMPEMDGLDVCRRLRGMPEGEHLPIIMCTAKGQRQDVLEALEAGATDYVVKPFTRPVLIEKLTHAIEKAASGHATGAADA